MNNHLQMVTLKFWTPTPMSKCIDGMVGRAGESRLCLDGGIEIEEGVMETHN